MVSAHPVVINTSARNLDRSLRTRLFRLKRVFIAAILLTFERRMRGANLYMSVSGGLGQLYETVFSFMARMRGMRLFMHHHSYAYLDERSLCTQLLLKTAGASAVHILLSEGMRKKLCFTYKTPHTISISNAVFFYHKENLACRPYHPMNTIGFFSNISAEKGIFEFLNLVKAMQDENLSVNAIIAGPFENSAIEKAVIERLDRLHRAEYVGPMYGSSKIKFFESIDVLVFPTRYMNEAEPIVVLEAMSRCVPVVAFGRGAIPEIIDSTCGRVIGIKDDFVSKALLQIKIWRCSQKHYAAASKAAFRKFLKIYDENNHQWMELLEMLTGKRE
jgi:glycosyltransferase involved in cell wall biosynthesis